MARMGEKPSRLYPLRIPAGWSVVWNQLFETPNYVSVEPLLWVKKDTWFVDVEWNPEHRYWLRVVRNESDPDDDPWERPLYEFQTGCLTELVGEVERVLDRGIY